MIIARCDKQLMSVKKLQTAISLLEDSLSQRSVSFLLRRREAKPHEICLVCSSSQQTDTIDQELQQENYTNEDEQTKEVILQEGQLLELRFRGNVLPNDYQATQSVPFAFNTHFPFYFEKIVNEVDKYSQHFSPCYYGFLQIFTKQKVLRTINKDFEKKKPLAEPVRLLINLNDEIPRAEINHSSTLIFLRHRRTIEEEEKSVKRRPVSVQLRRILYLFSACLSS